MDPLAWDMIFEEEEDYIWGEGGRRPRWIQDRKCHFEDLDNTDFFTRFRLTKPSVWQLLDQIEDRLEFRTFERNDRLTPMCQLLTALRFYATGGTQVSLGDFSGCSEPTSHRIVHRVSAAIASLAPIYIKFPESQQEITEAQVGFHGIAGFPRAIGALDCTHVKIVSPGGDHAEYYRNRKGYFSWNVQGICNAQKEFIDIVARWPGSAHDVTIFNSCHRKYAFETGRYGNAVLVADSGYASNDYMMLPLATVTTEAERIYNESQIRTRNPIECVFGIWKRRFPVLALGMRVRLRSTLPIIVATAVLHNIARRQGEHTPPDDPDLVLPAPWENLLQQGQIHEEAIQEINPNRQVNRADHARTALIVNYFQQLINQHRARRT